MTCPRCEKYELPSASDRFCLRCERAIWGGPRVRRSPETKCGDCGEWCYPGEPLCRECGGPALTAEERAERDLDADREDLS